MKDLNYTSSEMKTVIDNSKLISDNGFSSTVFLHGNDLIKLDKNLYSLLKVNSLGLADRVFKNVYMWNNKPFVEREQIEYLQSKQPGIKLTNFDLGVVLVNDRVCGINLFNHTDYKDLTYIDTDLETSLKILENILLAVKELENNEISHLDLSKAQRGCEPTLNILYRGTDIKLCDLSGRFITYGSNFNKEGMYLEYVNVYKFLLNKLKEKYPELKEFLSTLEFDKINNYAKSYELLDKTYKLVK